MFKHELQESEPSKKTYFRCLITCSCSSIIKCFSDVYVYLPTTTMSGILHKKFREWFWLVLKYCSKLFLIVWNQSIKFELSTDQDQFVLTCTWLQPCNRNKLSTTLSPLQEKCRILTTSRKMHNENIVEKGEDEGFFKFSPFPTVFLIF